MMQREQPALIQAGMGVHISSARLARATARLGAMGVVSGAGLRHIVVEDIRAGDPDALRFARAFPFPRYVEELLAYAPGGSRHDKPVPMDTPDPKRAALPRRLSVIGAYVEVMRAKEGHRGVVGVNVMWKCALTVLPTIYGAMLAGADALLCGAGVPMELADIVERLRRGEDLQYESLTGTGTRVRLDVAEDAPSSYLQSMPPPALIPILSNYPFCKRLTDNWQQRHGVRPGAFVLENHQAGGHNAPPRDKSSFGAQDDLDSYFEKVLSLGVPVYVAGAFPRGGSRDDLRMWQARGACGIQVGSRFALCAESGMRSDLREQVIAHIRAGTLVVSTDLRLSPTGYPFKVASLPGTLSDPELRAQRTRLCSLGYLLQSHLETGEDGVVRETYLCPAMPTAQYARRGGDPAQTEGRICLCNALLSTAGYGPPDELPLITLGVSGVQVDRLWSAREVVEDILTPDYVARRERELRLPA